MKALVTGALGLVGSEAVRYYLNNACEVIGVDNDMRKHFFGEDASVAKNKIDHGNYRHFGVDISKIEGLFENEKPDVIIHAAAQPSHDYSAQNPLLDFGINAYSTLMLLEMARKHTPAAVFIYLSTNKVYGDRPNEFDFQEFDTRYSIPRQSKAVTASTLGFNESLSIDFTTHSPFGVSKLAGDLYAQEYARYFGLKTGIFRCGCITGARHAGAELHGFLSYMVKCKKENKLYTVYGYKGKQVRDQLHASDLVRAIDCFVRNPKPGEVYNMGGGRQCNVSILEAFDMLKMKKWEYVGTPRKGDHKWYISDTKKFENDFPEWKRRYTLYSIFGDLMG